MLHEIGFLAKYVRERGVGEEVGVFSASGEGMWDCRRALLSICVSKIRNIHSTQGHAVRKVTTRIPPTSGSSKNNLKTQALVVSDILADLNISYTSRSPVLAPAEANHTGLPTACP